MSFRELLCITKCTVVVAKTELQFVMLNLARYVCGAATRYLVHKNGLNGKQLVAGLAHLCKERVSR